MKIVRAEGGFICVQHETYSETPELCRLIQESSAVGDYDDSFDNPGSSYLWVGECHHLDRDEVSELIEMMTVWLETKRLPTSRREEERDGRIPR